MDSFHSNVSNTKPLKTDLNLVTPLKNSCIDVKIQNNLVSGLIDTGASISCISKNLLNKTLQNAIISPSDITSITTVGRDIIHCDGSIIIDLLIAGEIIQHKFYIFDNIQHDLILGNDLLEENKALINLNDKTLTLEKGTYSIPFISIINFKCDNDQIHGDKDKQKIQSNSKSLIRSIYDIRIDPKSEMLVPGKVNKLPNNTLTFIHPNNQLQSKFNILGARNLANITDNKIHVVLLNLSDKPVYIKANSIIGTAYKVTNEEIISLNENKSESKIEINSLSSAHCPPRNKYVKKASELNFNLQNSDLNEEQKQRLLDLLGRFRDVFATSLAELGKAKGFAHRIETGDAAPVRSPPYRLSPEGKKIAEELTDEMLKNNIIEESSSSWASPIVMIKKPDGSHRFAVDYRKLNKVTTPMTHPLPLLSDTIDVISAAKAKVYSVIDLQQGFWQQELDPETKCKTGFITHQGTFEFNRLPFGLRNSPCAFQMMMNSILRGLNWKICLVYVDDLIIFSQDFETHLEDLTKIFSRLREANLTIKPSKCQFAKPQVKYLGHILSKDGIFVDESKLDAIREFPIPTNVKQMRSFLGICNYYRQFIKGYAHTARPLNRLLCKDVNFEWTEDCNNAFDTLKSHLISAPILVFPDFNKPFSVSTDASNEAIGYVLEQKDDKNRSRAIAYGGRSLHGFERNWSITEKEGLAVVEALKAYRPYLTNNHFEIYTDHISLKWLENIKDASGRLGRWSMFLQPFLFKIHHKPGSANGNADGLSRRPYDTPEPNAEEDQPVYSITKTDGGIAVTFEYENDEHQPRFTSTQLPLVAALNNDNLVADDQDVHKSCTIQDNPNLVHLQRQCPDLNPIIQYKETGLLPDNVKTAHSICIKSDLYEFEDGVLYYYRQLKNRGPNKEERLLKLLAVPTALRDTVLKSYHDSMFGGCHQGQERLYATIRMKYYWETLNPDVMKYVKTCVICQESKRNYHSKKVPLTPMPIQGVFERWHMDILQLTLTPDGYRYVLLVVDSTSKWPESFPMKDQNASTVADILFREIFTRYGAPRTLCSDLGQNFMSSLVKTLSEMLNIKRTHTTPYHPQTNATCERMNSFIVQSLKAYCDENHTNWPAILPGVMAGYRLSPATQSTGSSPFAMLFGKEMRLPIDCQLLPKETLPKSTQQYLQDKIKILDITRKIAKNNMERAQLKYKLQHDKKSSEPNFNKADKVWLFCSKVKQGLSPKLCKKWLGPYYIYELGPNYTFKLRRCIDDKPLKNLVNACRLKIFHDPATRPTNIPDISDTELDEEEIVEAPTNDPVQPTNDTSTSSQKPKSSNFQPNQIEKIIRSTKYQGKQSYKVKLKDGSTQWEFAETIPEALRRDFHIKRNASGKRRKRPLKGHKFFYENKVSSLTSFQQENKSFNELLKNVDERIKNQTKKYERKTPQVNHFKIKRERRHRWTSDEDLPDKQRPKNIFNSPMSRETIQALHNIDNRLKNIEQNHITMLENRLNEIEQCDISRLDNRINNVALFSQLGNNLAVAAFKQTMTLSMQTIQMIAPPEMKSLLPFPEMIANLENVEGQLNQFFSTRI